MFHCRILCRGNSDGEADCKTGGGSGTDVILSGSSVSMSGDSLSCVSSVSGAGVGSLVSCVADVGSSIFVSLGITVGSTTGLVSVLIPLELVPDNSVGVLTKIFPLRCRGSDPSGKSGWLRISTCVPFEYLKSCAMWVNVRAFPMSPLSRSIDRLSRSLRSRKCSGAHSRRRPCTTIQTAMSFFTLLLASAHFLSQNCRRTQPCTLVCSEVR